MFRSCLTIQTESCACDSVVKCEYCACDTFVKCEYCVHDTVVKRCKTKTWRLDPNK